MPATHSFPTVAFGLRRTSRPQLAGKAWLVSFVLLLVRLAAPEAMGLDRTVLLASLAGRAAG